MSTPDLITLAHDSASLRATFGPSEPVLRVRPGTPVQLFTEDCFGGVVRSVDDLPSRVCNLASLNPVTGPIYVEGAEPGDTLAVHLVDLRPARDFAISSTFPSLGALTATGTTAMLHDPLPERVWRYELDLDRCLGVFQAASTDHTVALPLDPMFGTIGVAPAAGQTLLTLTPAAHGGNMDTPEMRAGVTAYFGVNVSGALFAVGDGHARQGEGEACGTALESAMRATVILDVISGQATPWPRLESDDFVMSTGSSRPLEDAYRICARDLVAWTGALTGLDALDSYQVVSQSSLAPLANVVDPNYTALSKLPKPLLRELGAAPAYEGAHQRLRAQAGEL